LLLFFVSILFFLYFYKDKLTLFSSTNYLLLLLSNNLLILAVKVYNKLSYVLAFYFFSCKILAFLSEAILYNLLLILEDFLLTFDFLLEGFLWLQGSIAKEFK